MIAELEDAPDVVVAEVYDFLRFLKSKEGNSANGSLETGGPSYRPDFLARQQALFGERTLADSQELLEELRADRF